MFLTFTILLVFLALSTSFAKTSIGGTKYHIKEGSFGYDAEVGQVLFHGSVGDNKKGLRGLSTDNYVKTSLCGTSLTNYQALFTYFIEYTLANTCLKVTVTGTGGYQSAKLTASDNGDGTIDATMNYYTNPSCTGTPKVATTIDDQSTSECMSNNGDSVRISYTSTVTNPTDGKFEGFYDSNTCDKLIFGEDIGFIWGNCVGGTVYNSCSGSKLSYSQYANSDCTGSVTAVNVDMDTCMARTDDSAWEEDDPAIGDVGLPISDYPGLNYLCAQASDDDDVCFAGSETLLLESGERVSIENVSLGDRVQVAAADGALQFADVIALPHEKNNREVSFVELVTATGSLKATPSHLVMAGACDNIMSMKLIRAEDVPSGSCLATSEGSTEVTAAHMTKGYGVYSVVTSHADGLLVVNGFKASSFAINHLVVNAYYHVHRALYQFAPFLVKGMTSVSATLGALGATIASI